MLMHEFKWGFSVFPAGKGYFDRPARFPRFICGKIKDCLIIIRTLFLLTLFAVNFHAFNFELEEVWGHFWIALETSYSKMPSNFPWLKIKGMKIESKNRQQNKCPDNFETVLTWKSGARIKKINKRKIHNKL